MEDLIVNHEVLADLKELIKDKYGSLDDERGAYVNGRWLSVRAIVDLIDEVDCYC